MSKIINAVANDDYTITIKFDEGSSLNLNMQKHVKTLHFNRWKDMCEFKKVRFDEKSIFVRKKWR